MVRYTREQTGRFKHLGWNQFMTDWLRTSSHNNMQRHKVIALSFFSSDTECNLLGGGGGKWSFFPLLCSVFIHVQQYCDIIMSSVLLRCMFCLKGTKRRQGLRVPPLPSSLPPCSAPAARADAVPSTSSLWARPRGDSGHSCSAARRRLGPASCCSAHHGPWP